MEPIVGRINYKDVSPEEMTRYLYEAEIKRAEAICDMLTEVGNLVSKGFKVVTRIFHKADHSHATPAAH